PTLPISIRSTAVSGVREARGGRSALEFRTFGVGLIDRSSDISGLLCGRGVSVRTARGRATLGGDPLLLRERPTAAAVHHPLPPRAGWAAPVPKPPTRGART